MEYRLSVDQFLKSKMFDSKGKFFHRPGNRFKLFPFVANNSNIPVLSLESLIGSYLCKLGNKIPKELTANALAKKLKEDTEIEIGREELFDEMIRQVFFFANGNIRPLNLHLIQQIQCSAGESKIVEYLVDVLGDRDTLTRYLQDAEERVKKNSNVLEALVLSKLEYSISLENDQKVNYFRVTESLRNTFEEDFSYILDNAKRSREYMVPLLELYFFTYTAQTSLQLNRFLDGDRNSNIPLYFCLEWEKTSQSRLCYTDGWQKLQGAIKCIFAHAVVLEILNQTELDSGVVDYIDLARMSNEIDDDEIISNKIDQLTNCYREAIKDCAEMKELEKKLVPHSKTATSIKYLFDSVRVQFENTGRDRAYNTYAKKFADYCHNKYLKSRGRSGLMLNLSEETLIFLTKLCIKNQEQMRLKDVFSAFEKRSIFLDDFSKEQVAEYYEKLNLIEKKSDSGDAKYVKRIL